MQSLSATTSSANNIAACARDVLDTTPTLIRYIRFHMRSHRQGLSVPQFRALFKVRMQPAANLSVVAEHLTASLPTTSRVVTTLVVKGYLKRGDGAGDRRQVALFITARGRAILDAAEAATQAQTEARLKRLSPEDREAISHAMQLLRSLLATEAPPGRGASDGAPIAAPRRRAQVRRKDPVTSLPLVSAQRD